MELLPFVKIFQINGGQFLVRKAYNENDEKFEVVLSFSIKDGPNINFALSFISQENRDDKFEDFDVELAVQFVEKFDSFFQENPTTERTLELISHEEPVVPQEPLIMVASEEDFRQIAADLRREAAYTNQPPTSPLIIIP